MKKIISLILLSACELHAQLKISQLPASGTLTGTELLPVVQGGVTKQTTTQAIANLGVGGGGWGLTGNTVTALTNSIGTTNNFDLNIITNNTQRLKITSTGSVNIGNATTANQKVLRVGEGTSFIDFGERFGGQPGIWFNQAANNASLVAVAGSSVGATVLNGAGTGGIDIRSFGSNILILKGAQTSGSHVSYNFTPLPKTNQSSEANTIRMDGGSTQYSVAIIPLHREYYFRTNAVSATVPSTLTNMYNGYFEANTSGTNVTTTRNWALGSIGNAQITGSLVVGSSTVSPITTLDVRGSFYVSGASTLSNTTVNNLDAANVTVSSALISSNLIEPSGYTDIIMNTGGGALRYGSNILTWNSSGITSPNIVGNTAFSNNATISGSLGVIGTTTLTNVSASNATVTNKMYVGGTGVAPTAHLHLAPGVNTAGGASLKFTSGTLLTTPEAGALEFLGKYYGTDGAGPTRREFCQNNAPLTLGQIPVTNANGFFDGLSNFTHNGSRLSPQYITLSAGTTAANTSPLRFASGPLMTTPEVGAIEFLTDKFYCTSSTPTRYEFTLNNIALTAGRVPFSTTNGRLTDLAGFTYATNRLSPTYITLGAGAAAAGSAPLVMTTGPVLTTKIAGAWGYTTPRLFFTNGRLLEQEIPQIQQSRVTTNFNATSNTTLANITGLTANVAISGTYKFRAVLYTTSDITAGVKFSIGGTAVATSVIYESLVTDAGLTTQTRGTALAATVGAVTAVTAAYCVIEGIITVTTAGTLTVQFAQNVSNAVSSVVLAGSNFQLQEIN